MLTVLNVAYPLAPVGPDAVGGAEQILSALDHGIVAAGHRSIVVGMSGSRVAGELVASPVVTETLDERRIEHARREHATLLRRILAATQVDVVHMHGPDFGAYLPDPGPPVLATLHCPREWYEDRSVNPQRERTWLNAVSERQHAAFMPNDRLLQPIENGVPFHPGRAHRTGSFALVMARIAPEKGIHVALRCAHRAGLPMVVAGHVYPYPEHQRYFDREVKPLLDSLRRFIGPAGGERKQALLSSARCIVVASQVEESSSLAAREALAAGTPVVAFPAGAVVDVIENGVTGYVVADEAAMARAMVIAGGLSRSKCRELAQARFDRARMVQSYIEVYERLAAGG